MCIPRLTTFVIVQMEVHLRALARAPNPKYRQAYYHGRQNGNLRLKIESK